MMQNESRTRSVLLALLALIAASAAQAGDDAVRIEDAWARAMPPGAPATAIYLSVINEDRRPLTITGADCTGARRTMLHETIRDDGVDRMRHVAQWVVPAGGRLELAPGGRHLMAMGLAPAEGRQVRCVLHTDRGTIAFDAPAQRR